VKSAKWVSPQLGRSDAVRLRSKQGFTQAEKGLARPDPWRAAVTASYEEIRSEEALLNLENKSPLAAL
jgi:hypothetical protein